MGIMALRVLKGLLAVILWGLFMFWVVEWFIYPTERYTAWKADAITIFNSKFFELNGPFFLMWSFPVILFALFGLLYLEVDQRCSSREGAKEMSKWRRFLRGFWTQPILVKSPMGVLTGMDLIVVSFVLFATLWIFFKPLGPLLEEVDRKKMGIGISRWMIKVGRVGTWTGRAWYLPMALLFIPVSRNSPFLRLVNLPFEHAVRFHRWLGYFSLVILLLHSITFSLHIYYTGGPSAKGIFEWPTFGVSNLAGVISMAAGIVMWVTSLEFFRKRFYDVFFITHHMYILVFAFGVWHIGEFSSFFFLAGVLLFFIDRFVRMVQSQAPVSILSARVLPSGVVELKFPKVPELKYSALGVIFINIPGVSKFQWHPFSTTSSSFQNPEDITICIKALGGWTRDLKNLIESADSKDLKSGGCPLSMQLFGEGPYGVEKDYFLDYKKLVLVAGGVGVTPFIAVIRDLLCRYQAGYESKGLPAEVRLIWCAPRAADLATLRDLKPSNLFSGYAGGALKIDVDVYVTREQAPVGSALIANGGQEHAVYNNMDEVEAREMAVKDVRGSNLWYAAVIAASTAGFMIIHGILHNYVVRPNHHSTKAFYFEHGSSHGASHGPDGPPFPTWATVSLMFISMVLGVVVFGGAVLIVFYNCSRKQSATAVSANGVKSGPKVADLESNEDSLLEQARIYSGMRPNLSELLEDVGAGGKGDDVGVLVSGPKSMEDTVASACRSFNFGNPCSGTKLHFHSISFDL